MTIQGKSRSVSIRIVGWTKGRWYITNDEVYKVMLDRIWGESWIFSFVQLLPTQWYSFSCQVDALKEFLHSSITWVRQYKIPHWLIELKTGQTNKNFSPLLYCFLTKYHKFTITGLPLNYVPLVQTFYAFILDFIDWLWAFCMVGQYGIITWLYK